MKELQNVKDAFLKKLSDIEQSLENLKKKITWWEICEFSKLTGKQKLVFERWNQKES